MPKKPVISKIRCHHPNKKSTAIRNRNLLYYVGTRDGVDLTPVKTDKEFLNKEMNIKDMDDENYLENIEGNYQNCGLFGNIKCNDAKETANLVYKLSREGRNIYNGVISLAEEDAIALGYDEKEKWVQLMNKMMPSIAKQFNISITQLEWTAAVHMEKGHPHCHYMFWNREKKVKSPYIHYSVQNRCREMFSKEIYEQERIAAVIDKTAKRDFILEFGKELMEDELSYLFKNEIPGRIKKEDTNAIGALLINLSEKLPTSGRITYQFVSPELKNEVDNVTSYILRLPALKKSFDEFVELNQEIMKTYSTGKTKEEYKTQRAIDDLKKRIGNQVLKSAKELCLNRDAVIDDAVQKCMEYLPNKIDNSILYVNEHENVSDEPGSLQQYEETTVELDLSCDNTDFIIEWNDNYKMAMHYLYDPKEKDLDKAISYLDQELEKNNVIAIYEKARLYDKKLIPSEENEANTYFKKSIEGFKSILNSDYKNKEYIHYRIGKMYQYGQGVEQDEYKAVEEYKKSGNNKYAQYALGNMYLRGQGVDITIDNKKDYEEKALNLFKSSAEQGNAYASYAYASLAEKSFNSIGENEIENYYKIALNDFVDMYRKSPNDDLAYKVACMYYSGKGTDKDIDKSIFYLEESKQMQNMNAEYLLGRIYAAPETKYYNLADAISSFEMVSSSKGYMKPFADYQLGKIYSEVLEVLNIPKAIEYLENAASQGNEYAQCKLGDIYSKKDNIYTDVQKAWYYYNAAAEQGNATGQYQLGKLQLEKGQVSEAIDLFLKSAVQGNSYSYYQLGKIHLAQNNQEDAFVGKEYLQSAIKLGNESAQIELGCIYLFGKCEPYIKKDVEKGIMMLKEIAQQGNVYAQTVLEFYDKYREVMANSLAYGACRNAFNMLTNLNNQRKIDKLAETKLHRVHSKEMKKVIAKRGREMDHED